MKYVKSNKTKRKIRAIAQFAYLHTEFYKHLYSDIDLKTVELPDGLPIIEQSDLAHHALEFKSDVHAIKAVASSGTASKPKLMFRTQGDFEKSVLNQMELMSWCKVTGSDVVGIVQPSGIWGYAELTAEASRRMGAMFIHLGNVSDIMCIELILANKISVLDISPSRLDQLMQCYEEQFEPTDMKFPVKIVMSAGEVLKEKNRKRLSDKYGFIIYNQYGSEEFDALGGELDNKTAFNLFYNDYFFEVLDDGNRPVKKGEVGHLVVTSLYHQGTPLIRYNLNDLVKETQEGLIVLGRNSECIMLYDSVKLLPYQIEEVIYKYIKKECLNKYQIQVYKDSRKKDLIQVILDAEEVSFKILQKITGNLSTCSLDVYELCKNDMLHFKVTEDKNLMEYSRRGKMFRTIDKR